MPSVDQEEKTAVRKLRREGSSFVVTLPRDLCDQFREGGLVVIRQVGRTLVLSPLKQETE